MIASDNLRGAALMATAMTAFVVNDALMRDVLEALPFFQSLFLRGVVVTVLLGLVVILRENPSYRPDRRDGLLIGARIIGELGATICFLSALTRMPFATLSAILQTLPLSVTFAAAIFLGTPIGWRRLLAILIGFLGVLLIIRPGAEGLDPAAILAIGVVLASTLRDVSTRAMGHGVPAGFVSLLTSGAVTVMAGLMSVAEVWQMPDGEQALRMSVAGCLIVVAYLSIFSAMRQGEIAFVAPFRYTSLLVALVLGLVVFGERPAPLTLLGAAIVVGMGLYTLYREQRAAR